MALSQRRARIVGRLKVRKTREREGLVLVEGVRASTEALIAGASVSFAVTSAKLETTEAGAELQRLLAGHDVESVDDREVGALADTRSPQGVLLVCREPVITLTELAGRRFLVLDAIQDPGNLGTLIRSANAFGLDGVVCLDGTADPWGAKAVRASAGLVFRPTVALGSVEDTLARLGELGVPVLVADATGVDAEGLRGAERFALVVGNEGAGVRTELRDAASASVAVRMTGPAESLNVGIAGSILMHTLSGGKHG